MIPTSTLQVAETRTHIGSGLLHLGIKPGSTVGLYSVNHTGTCKFEIEIAKALAYTTCIARYY